MQGSCQMKKTDLLIIGGGPAGLAAAVAAFDNGIRDILIIERDKELGGILNQCIHNGFGLHTFKEELTGPEYALRYIKMVKEREIPYLLRSMVTGVQAGNPLKITVMSPELAPEEQSMISAKAVILAMGCRERARGALNIPGFRPAGIFTAGCAQRYVNIEGFMPGRQVVVLGSGDIGLIMARRMKLQGADVKMVVEIMPYSGGLKRNIVQCLEDFDIPLKLSHTVIDIDGKDRVRGVVTAKVNEAGKPIPGTEEYVACDTLLLSCGLIPENELSRSAGTDMDEITQGPIVNKNLETTVRGIFACGNVLHVHDLVDNVSAEAVKAGKAAADFIKAADLDNNQDKNNWGTPVRPKIAPKSRYIPPKDRDFSSQFICIGCPKGCLLTVAKEADGNLAVTGNSCPIGEEYAKKEITAPTRIVTSLIRMKGGTGPVISVKTATDIPKKKIAACISEICQTEAAAPVTAGDILIANAANTGIDIIATADMAAGIPATK